MNYFVVMTDQMTVDIMDEIEGKKVLFTDCRLYSNYLRNGQNIIMSEIREDMYLNTVLG